MAKELLSIIKEDGHCNIDFRISIDPLTREDFEQVAKMTYYALKTLEENIFQETEVTQDE